VLWPEREGTAPAAVKAACRLGTLHISRPDGKTDQLTFTHDSIILR
jgi:hypothetical protein